MNKKLISHYDQKMINKHEKLNALQNYIFVTNNDKQKSCDELMLEEFDQKNYDIIYINNPIKELQLAAIQKDVYAINYIRKPCKEAKLLAKIMS